MHADVGGNAATLVNVAFPRSIIPVATRSDIRQINVVNLIFRTFIHFFLQCYNLVMETQLQDSIDLMFLTFLHLLQGINVPRIKHQRFLTNDIGTKTQTVTRVRIMQIVRSTYRDIVDISAVVA